MSVRGDGSSARVDAATALRRLSHLLVGRDTDEDQLVGIARWADEQSSVLDSRPRRLRNVTDSAFADPSASSGEASDGDAPFIHFDDSVISGAANPVGLAMTFVRDNDRVRSQTVLGRGFEGAPGRAHGGIVAAMLDDAMGFVLAMEATPAYTGRLQVTYRAPVPVGEEIEVAAVLRARAGRKLVIDATVSRQGAVLAAAEGLFIAVEREAFLRGSATVGEPTSSGRTA